MRKLTVVLVLTGLIAANATGQIGGDPPADLLSFYEFEGDYSNSGSGTVEGQPEGAATIITDPDRGQVLCLDGSTGTYVRIDNDDLDSISTEITIAAWVKSNVTDQPWGAPPIGKAYNWRIYVGDDEAVFFQVMDTQPQGTSIVTVTNIITDMQWHHVAGTYDGARYKLYIDGVQDTDPVEATGDIANNVSHVFALGAFVKKSPDDIKRFFNGCIDNVRVYNRALSAAEISDIVSPRTASLPQPPDGAVVATSLQELSWRRPQPRQANEQDPILCDVWFGTDPNEASPTFSFDKIESRLDADSTANFTPKPLTNDTTYYWKVDCYDPNNGVEILTEGSLWSFETGNVPPVAWAGLDKVARLSESTVSVPLDDATVEDDGLPTGSTLTQLWTVVSKPAGATVVFDPDDNGNLEQSDAINPTVTIDATGTYVLRLTADDEDLTHFDQVTIQAPSCESIKQAGFQLPGDIDGDCDVDLADFAALVADWAGCNDPQVLTCDRPFM